MSRADARGGTGVRVRSGAAARSGAGRRRVVRLVGSEVRLVLTRRRNIALLGVLALVPVLIGVAVRFAGGPDTGSVFATVTDNGVFLVFAALVAVVPVFLPLAVAVVAGDAVAGEANSGTLRYLLVVPVGRARVLVTKYVAVVVWAVACAAAVALAGALTGVVLFPAARVTLLSGTTTSWYAALPRVGGAALYAAVMMASVGAVGLLMSTLTEVPIAAMAATLGVVIASGVVDVVPQLRAVGPALPTHHWLAFADLLRDPVDWGAMRSGLLVTLAWVVVAGTLAWARFSTKDVTG